MRTSKFILIIGGGKIGSYLARELYSQGNEIVLVEREKSVIDSLRRNTGYSTVYGDGCELGVLREAGIERADVVVATTGYDEDNYVICTIAKTKFGVPRTVSRLRDPKNEELFKKAGIDQTVSSTRIIFNMLEKQIESSPMIPVTALQNGNIEVVQIEIDEDSPAKGVSIIDLGLPKGVLIISILRNDTSVIPQASTVFEENDTVLILMPGTLKSDVSRFFVRERL
ncbi:MAG: TrkA family potassium uptake protein [Abditibacteriota bacterium]|nr:TrkA family potassium uptake protein [Abditibacteriota bacterium]